MKKNRLRALALGLGLALGAGTAWAQPAVAVGKGSYAAYAPLAKSRSDEHGGDQSRYMQYRTLNIREEAGRPIPTNDWWTNMLNADDHHVGQELTGHLWSYPQFVQGMKYGVDVQYPKYWIDNGTEVKAQSKLTVRGEDFAPRRPMVESWSDWAVTFSEEDGGRRMTTTMAHGVPFTWIELEGLEPVISAEQTRHGDTGNLLKGAAEVRFLDAAGRRLEGTLALSRLVVEIAGEATADRYGLYLPEGARVTLEGGTATVRFGGQERFVVVALLDEVEDLDFWADYAYSKPERTEVSWDYDEAAGRLTTHWAVEATDLRTGRPTDRVVQGFLPHLYRNGAEAAFPFTGKTFLTPHGRLRLAAGARLDVAYRFYGILPWYALPLDDGTDERSARFGRSEGHPFDRGRMLELLRNYAAGGTFGADTYWGGKGLTQMALYMSFAREMGETELFRLCHDRLKAVLVDWLTYEPGESNRFFARDSRFGGLIGYDTSYDSDTYNDHHFHYGYYTLAGAMLALVDDDFRDHYGPMLRLVAKDYANWERDGWACFFRTFDPWGGHSFAGGMGDGNGNGQESTSEAMQGWGGLYLLGVALGDRAMRDAGIFGWVSEARGTAEYWFDRHGEVITADFHQGDDPDYNIDYTKLRHYDTNGELKYVVPYNSNYTCHGVGWWTYFSGDPVWMAGIQWMPISPALDYLSEDKDFAAWDFARMWDIKEIGGWYEHGTRQVVRDGVEASEDTGCLGEESGIGNVVLSYLQRSNPELAAEVLDNLWTAGKGLARATDTGGISYFVTHSHLTYGDIDWTVNGSVPTARAYRRGGTLTYMGYNPLDEPQDIRFYRNGTLVHTLEAVPARQLRVSGVESVAVQDIVQESAEADDPRAGLSMANLALGKPCTESSHENAGTVPAHATDGDLDTRWGSEHSDNQWLEVDLGQMAKVYRVRIHWEAAFASEYRLQLYDGQHRLTHEQTVQNGQSGWVETLMGDHEGRYVRMQGVARGTAYGYSLHELEVYGQTADMGEADILGVRIACEDGMLKQGEPSQLRIEGYTCGGEWVAVDPEWGSDDGTITPEGVFTPAGYGVATVWATLGGEATQGGTPDAAARAMTATASYPVEEAVRIASLAVEPQALTVVLGEEAAYEVVKKDQFGVVVAREERVYEATAEGVFEVPVEEDGCRDVLTVTVCRYEDINLALNGKVGWSSANGDADGTRVADGDRASRWESQWGSDDEWLTLDLRQPAYLQKVVLRWEAARAAAYVVEASMDGQAWLTVAEVADPTAVSDAGGLNDVLTMEDSLLARFVRLRCLERAMPAYGYSLYEMEVYGLRYIPVGIEAAPVCRRRTDEAVYNLAGQRLRRPVKGLHIRGGKKIYGTAFEKNEKQKP